MNPQTHDNRRLLCRVLASACCAALLSAAPALAQAGMGQAPPQQPQPMGGATRGNPLENQPDHSMQDKSFVHNALEGGMAEVALGKLAAEKGSSDEVKQFGQKMVEDHTRLGEDMKAVAEQVGVTPPRGLSKKDQKLLAKLQTLNGAEFDQAYVRAMVKDHEEDEAEFRNEAQDASLPQVKDAAAKGEQVISMHLQMIRQIAQTQGVTASAR